MGIERNHAIVVSTFNLDYATAALAAAHQIFPAVSGLLPGTINEVWTFLIPPDGSKEGWADSEIGDERREKFIKWLDSKKYVDGSSPYNWVEVSYGHDENRAAIIDSNCSRLRGQ